MNLFNKSLLITTAIMLCAAFTAQAGKKDKSNPTLSTINETTQDNDNKNPVELNYLLGFLQDPKHYVADDEDIIAKVLILLRNKSETAVDEHDVRNYLKIQQKLRGTIGSVSKTPRTDEQVEEHAAQFVDGYIEGWKDESINDKAKLLEAFCV